jgi:hypothetical protein
VVRDQGLLGVVDQAERLERQGQVADERVPHPLDAVALLLDVVRGPQPTELLALHGELAHQGGQLRVVRMAARVHAQITDDVRRLLVPLDEQLAVVGPEEHQPRPVPLRRRQLRPVAEEGRGHPVPGQDLRAAPDDVRRDGVDRVQQMPQRRPYLLGPRRLLLLVLLRLRQVHQVGVLGAGQPQGPRDRVQHLRRDVAPVALLQPCVVRHGHPGQLCQLLTAQPRNPPPPEVGQPHVLRLQPGTPGAQELTELGALVQAPAGLRCGLLYGFGLFVHALQYSRSYAHEPDPASGTHAVRTQNRGLGRHSRVWHGGDRARSEHQKAAGHGTN